MKAYWATLMGLFLVSAVVCPPQAHASFSQALDLENRVEQRLRAILAPWDAKAIVLAKATYQKESFELPGLDLAISDLTPEASSGPLSLENLERLDIQIFSQRPLSQALKKALWESVHLPGARKSIQYREALAEFTAEAG